MVFEWLIINFSIWWILTLYVFAFIFIIISGDINNLTNDNKINYYIDCDGDVWY
jgi:hypothetical protein